MQHTHRPTLSGVDVAATGGLDALFAAMRARFGDARMMADPEPPADTPPEAAPTPPAPGKEPAGAPPAQSVEDLPEWAQKEIRETRKEAADSRGAKNTAETAATAAEAAKQATLDGIAKALGLKDDDAPPSADALTRTISERDQRIADLESAQREALTEAVLLRAAIRNGGNPEALADSRSVLAAAAKVDLTADGAAGLLDEIVKNAIKANSGLAAVQIASASDVGLGVGGGAPSIQSMSARENLRAGYTTT